MGLECTIICIDNSDYMRNGDFVPTRLQAQRDAVGVICHAKTRANPENSLGLITLASNEVLVTLTSDSGRLLSLLHQVQPNGNLKLTTGLRRAQLALRYKASRSQKSKIVAFVGSPVVEDERELTRAGKLLKKECCEIDIICFGEDNTEKLSVLVNAANGKDSSNSHLITIPTGPSLSDALMSSPVLPGMEGVLQGGGGYEFGVDPNEDPELALALRVSMEEQRHRQEEEARKAAADSAREAGVPMTDVESSEDALLKQALQMSRGSRTDVSAMSEEEQFALAMQMSLDQQAAADEKGPVAMDTSEDEGKKAGASAEHPTDTSGDDDYSEVINDPAFLQSVLEGLPGVDPQSDAIRNAMSALAKQDEKKDTKKEPKK